MTCALMSALLRFFLCIVVHDWVWTSANLTTQLPLVRSQTGYKYTHTQASQGLYVVWVGKL
jgi:hypothetical protein